MFVLGASGSDLERLSREADRMAALAGDLRSLVAGSPPGPLGSGAPVLERWSFGMFSAPCLVGLATGHPTLPGQARAIATSEVLLVSEDRAWARTLSRWYRLGRPRELRDLDS